MNKFFISSVITLAAAACFAAPSNAGESSIVIYESSEVKLKSSTDCKNEFKFSFIKKLDSLAKSRGITAKRFERLKSEIKKLRERTVARIDRINTQIEKLNEEKKGLACLLKELDSSEIGFNKINILADEKTSETSLDKK